MIGDTILTNALDEGEFVVGPDASAQIVEQFDDGEGLVGRPAGVDEQFETLPYARG